MIPHMKDITFSFRSDTDINSIELKEDYIQQEYDEPKKYYDRHWHHPYF